MIVRAFALDLFGMRMSYFLLKKNNDNFTFPINTNKLLAFDKPLMIQACLWCSAFLKSSRFVEFISDIFEIILFWFFFSPFIKMFVKYYFGSKKIPSHDFSIKIHYNYH